MLVPTGRERLCVVILCEAWPGRCCAMVRASSTQDFHDVDQAELAAPSQQQLSGSTGQPEQSTEPTFKNEELTKQAPENDAARTSNLVRRSRRRKRHEVEVELKKLWELHRRFSEIGAAAEIYSIQVCALFLV